MDRENAGWLLVLFILGVVLLLVVWISFLGLNVFWMAPFYRFAALAGYLLCLVLGVYFCATSVEIRDRFAYGGYALISLIILVWFVSMLGTRYGWWTGLQIHSAI